MVFCDDDDDNDDDNGNGGSRFQRKDILSRLYRKVNYLRNPKLILKMCAQHEIHIFH